MGIPVHIGVDQDFLHLFLVPQFKSCVEHGAVVAQNFGKDRGSGGAEHVVVFNGLVAPQVAHGPDEIAGQVGMRAGAGLAFGGDGNACHGLDDGIFIGTVLGGTRGATFIGCHGPGSRYGPGQGGHDMRHILGGHATSHEHGGVGLGAVGVAAGNAVVLLANSHNLIPHPFHVDGAQHPNAENNARNIVADDGMVKDLFAAHGLDGNDIGVFGALLEGLDDLPGVIAVAHINHVGFAQVCDGRAIGSLQAVIFKIIVHLFGCLSGNLATPFGIVGHLKNVLVFDLDGGMAHDGHPLQGIPVGPLIFPQQGLHGLFTARPGVWDHFGMNKAPADLNSSFSCHRIFGSAEHHFCSAAIGHFCTFFSCHFYPPLANVVVEKTVNNFQPLIVLFTSLPNSYYTDYLRY